MYGNSKFSAKSEEVLRLAHKAAAMLGHSSVGSEHLLYGILARGDGIAASQLLKYGITREKLYLKIKSTVGFGDATESTPQGLTENARRTICRAFNYADKEGSEYINTDHLLLGIINGRESTACKMLTSCGVDLIRLQNELLTQSVHASAQNHKSNSEKLIRQFGHDLTSLAESGTLDPVIGREEEIDRMICILTRRCKNNPLLVGEPGVGKTCIAEGLAHRIIKGDVPDLLKNHRIISLDMPTVIAGTKYRGEFEDRVKNILREVKSNGKIILFIDEIHTIVGAGAAEGAIDAANILKPCLARGEIKLIGATTNGEYRRHIEKDKALERRFEPIKVNEPSRDKTLQILKGLAPIYSAHHHTEISEEIMLAAIDLSTRYLCGRHLPDKAIDLVDEAASRAAFEGVNVTEEHLIRAIFDRTGIPVVKSCDRKDLFARISKKVFGQDTAVRAVCNAVLRFSVGLSDEGRPFGTFLFLGKSGVGKTQLAKALAEEMFCEKDAFIRLDMSEYTEKHTISKLLGSPPGYVGYRDGGYLTDKVRRNPYSLILFDEVEKAHPDVLNILLQILEDGALTDSAGNFCNFKNTVIIMTSNVAGDLIDPDRKIGFLKDSSPSFATLTSHLKKRFSPELLNRIDDIVLFEPLSIESLEKIAEKQIAEVTSRCEKNGINIQIDPAIVTSLATRAFEQKQGARPLRRMIEQEIITKIAEIQASSPSTKSIDCILCNNIPYFMHN